MNKIATILRIRRRRLGLRLADIGSPPSVSRSENDPTRRHEYRTLAAMATRLGVCPGAIGGHCPFSRVCADCGAEFSPDDGHACDADDDGEEAA